MITFPHRHLLGIKGLTEQDITYLLDRAGSPVPGPAESRLVERLSR